MKRNGFTLVEIIAVVVILLIITLFATPTLKKLIANGNKTGKEIIEERVLIAAKEYASSYNNSFYDKLVKTGDYNYIYKTDLLNSGLIDDEDIAMLDNFVGVKGELLSNDKIKYTLSYIDNNISSNSYSNQELYTMLQALTDRVSNVEQNGGGSSGSGSTSALDSYPVGSIYLSISNINPETIFGGTWVSFGSGKTLVGVDTNDSDFNTAEKTGGSKKTTYTPVGTIGSHALTVSELPSHTHSIPSLSGTAASAGKHGHNVHVYDQNNTNNTAQYWNNAAGTTVGTSPNGGYFASGTVKWSSSSFKTASSCADVSGGGDFMGVTSSNGAHTHSVTTNASTTGSSGSGNGHTHTFTGTSSNIDILDPYITVYMWKRTA